jgi:cytochrome c553
MRLTLKHLVGLALLVAAGGFLIAWSGLVSIAASSGHWAPVGWFLHFTMRQAVDTQSLGIEPPLGFDHPDRVALGAAHYASGCAPCHGAPGEAQSPVALAMTPPPPWLPPVIPTWEARHLFWIVQHGVKYSGMPAWTTQERPDEVWSVVAFLGQMPDMEASAYRRMAFGSEAAPTDGVSGEDTLGPLVASCDRCHGTNGTGRWDAGVPVLAGQSETYLAATLRAYAEQRRASGIMQPLARELESRAIDALAHHYAIRPRQSAASPPTEMVEPVVLGEAIARSGIPAAGIPPCMSCHGPPTRYPHYPELAGQDAAYFARQLELFRDGVRGGTAFAHIMQSFAGGLTDRDIAAVAAFYQSLEGRTEGLD